MIRTWARAHNLAVVGPVAAGCLLLIAVAGSTSFVAPRQPIPLVWPLAMVQASVALLIVELRFGDLPSGAVREVADRALACLLVVATIAATAAELRFVGAPDILTGWMCSVTAVGLAAAAMTGVEAWTVSLVLGLLGVGAEFATRLAPVSRLMESPRAGAIVLALLLASLAAHVLKPWARLRS